jgi:hypothetical protein
MRKRAASSRNTSNVYVISPRLWMKERKCSIRISSG